MAYIARKGAEGHAKKKQGAPAEASAEDVATLPKETWPVEGQQGWSEKEWEQNFDTSSDGRESGREGKGRW